MEPVLPLLRRGALAGLAAGGTASLFGLAFAEPVIGRAIELEAARAAAAGEHAHAELFSRSTQQGGLLVASCLTGLALGVLFALLYAATQRAQPDSNVWRRSVWLGAGSFFAVSLLPFLRYPANPPGVGDTATVDSRTTNWLLAIALGAAAAVAAARLAGDLQRRGARTSTRQLAACGVLFTAVGVSMLLPASRDALVVPADLLWTFRLLSLATSALLWAVLTAVFGRLTERAGAQVDERTTAASSV